MNGLTIEILDGPNYAREGRGDDAWEHNAYALRLRFEGRTMDTPWKQGLGITDDPSADDVLEAIASDAAGVVNSGKSFEDWADEYGYDTDSREAERTFNAVVAQTELLRELLGDKFDSIVFPEDSADE